MSESTSDDLSAALMAPMTDEEAEALDTTEGAARPRRLVPPAHVRELERERELDDDEQEDDGEDEQDENEQDNAAAVQPEFVRPKSPSQFSRSGGRPMKKKKGRQIMAGNAPPLRKEPPREEIPREELLALATQYPEVHLDIVRLGVNGSGRAGIKGVRGMPISALFDLQTPVSAFCGGGKFEFWPLDPVTRGLISPRWHETYEGRPIVPKQGTRLVWSSDQGKLIIAPDPELFGVSMEPDAPAGAPPPLQAFQQMGMMNPFGPSPLGQVYASQPQVAGPQIPPGAYDRVGNLMPPPPDLVPPWMRSFGNPPSVQWAHVLDEARKGNQAAAAATQQTQGQAVALDWVQHNLREQGHLQANAARLEERSQRLQADFEVKLENAVATIQNKLDTEREARQRAERQLEQSQVEAKYAALAARFETQRPAPPDMMTTMMPGLIALAGAFVPVMVEGRKAQAALAQADRDSQTKLLTTVLAKEPPNTIAQYMPLISAVMPLVLDHIKTNSPKAQAEVLALEHDQRMMMLKMMSDMVKESLPDAPPAWQPLVEMGVQWLGQTMHARQLAQQQRAALPAQTQQHALPQNGGAHVAPPAVVAAPLDAYEPTLQQFAGLDAEAANLTRMIWQRLPPSAGFHTHEWLTIIFNLHAKLDVDEAAEMICSHLYHCQKFALLPAALTTVFEDGKTDPALRTIVSVLPIFQTEPDYCNAVIAKVASMINEIEEDDDEEEQEAAGVVDAIVTPAPGEPGIAVVEQHDATASA